MQNNILSKNLVVGIVLLFIGTNMVSAFNGNKTINPNPMNPGNWLYVGGNGTGNYTTIQSAIDAANSGDTVFVYDDSSPYYENLYIDKSIYLIGEDKNSTIIDGGEAVDVVNVTADWVTIKGFTIQNGKRASIFLYFCSNNTISEDIICNSIFGLGLSNASHNKISDCQIINNYWGINIYGELGFSDNNIITNCLIANNSLVGIQIWGSANNILQNNTLIFDSIGITGSLEECTQTIDTTNTVNGKPVYYFLNEKDLTIDNWEIGELILVNCTGFLIKNIEISGADAGLEIACSSNNTVLNCDFSNNLFGLFLFGSSQNILENNTLNNNTGWINPFPGDPGGLPSSGISILGSNNNKIRNNNASNNCIGIFLLWSTDNTIEGNKINSNNISGVSIYDSSNNTIYHNNFIDNTQNAYDNGTNIWDDGKKGNFWDDYKEKYPHAHKKCCKGIWDTPYEIPGGDNKDRYPLIKQWPYPNGRIIFTAHSTGPCGVAWGYSFGNQSNQTPDAYIEPGKGFMINFGTMLYHSLYGPYTNYLIEDNAEKKLWPLRQRTYVDIKWQHENVRHHLMVICKPLEETTGSFFSDPVAYLISPPPTYEIKNHLSNCMKFNGFHRNGSKIESVSGFAVLIAVAENNSWTAFPEPTIIIWLFQKKDSGEIEPVLNALWSKNGMDLLGTTIENGKSFYVNFQEFKF